MAYTGSVPFESLFRRCVTGCGGDTPACPSCVGNEVCSLVPPTCYECQKTICVAASSAVPSTFTTSTNGSSSGPNLGAIVGGVLGGVIVIAVATYLIWRTCIRKRMQHLQEEAWVEETQDKMAAEPTDFATRRDARMSTHTVGSIASTVLTRASNIIQIAYIPGVTNRSSPSTPGLLVPPVPPIPIALSPNNPNPASRYEQEHFFMPGDLRDSTYSGNTDRTSFARASFASTAYAKNAVLSPIPAQTVIRGKAAVVSVRSNGGKSGELTPPVPSVDYSKYGPPSPAFSVGSAFLNSVTAATSVKPQMVRVVTPRKVSPNSQTEEELAQHQGLLGRDSTAITIIDDTPSLEQGPFQDPPSKHFSTRSLSAVAEEASKKSRGDGASDRATTPFGDENELKE